MGRILTFLIFFWLGLSPLIGQRLITRQPIEGFRGSGEILAYSNSRIFLQLNKDGEWPRQIQWVILEGIKPLCAITFNKVGWQYTSSTDSCAIDWMRLDPSTYRYRLFVVESVPSPSETLPDRVAESILLTRTPSNPLPVFDEVKPQSEVKSSSKAQDTGKSTTDPSNIDLTVEDSIYSIAATVPLTLKPTKLKDSLEYIPLAITPAVVSVNPFVEPAENGPSTDQPLLSDSITHAAPPSIRATTASNTMELTLEKSAVDAQKPSQIDMLLSPVESSPTDLPDSPSLNSGSTISPDTIEETPDYIFTVPDYQPRRRWFGGKKKPSTPAATNSPAPPVPQEFEFADEAETAKKTEFLSVEKTPVPSETPLVASKIENDTSVYLQNAPFISVASFETLEYTQQVLQQFTCPGGCMIVRSAKGLYYRIGFYPDPKNIAVDLREIRKKYPDAWLVKL